MPPKAVWHTEASWDDVGPCVSASRPPVIVDTESQAAHHNRSLPAAGAVCQLPPEIHNLVGYLGVDDVKAPLVPGS